MGRPAVLKIDIVADAKAVGRGVREADKGLAGLGSNARKHGRTIALGFAAAAAGAVAFGKTAVDAASDLGETTSKSRVLFGQQSKAVEAFASSAAKSYGQSKQQALDAAASFATFGKAAGLSGNDLVKFSTDFTGLASDLASFNNTSPEQAINAIGSALRGEAEPLRQYGVLLDDASLRQQALKLGLIETTKDALTPQQKVLAAQALIYAQTGAAQGDFARTSTGLANQQRILSAEFTNLQAQLGAKLLPIVVKVTSSVVTFTQWVGKNRATIVPLVAVVGTLVGVVWAINTAARAYAATQAALNVVMALNPVGLVVIAIAALVAGVVLAYKKSETFRTGVQALWTMLKKLIGFTPFGVLLKSLDDIWRKIKSIGSALKDNALTKGLGKLGGLFGSSSVPLVGAGPQLVGSGPALAPRLRGLATAGAADPLLADGLSWRGGAGGVLVIDRRDQRQYVRAEGALDPVGTAQTVARLLGDREVRQGRLSAWGQRS